MSEVPLSSVDSGYALRRKQQMSFVTQLRAIGAQADLDLPRIAVIGNQSAGKSSLVEAISGISVPRDAGTCTRCPMECRLSSSSNAWQCQVSIRWEVNSGGFPCDEVREVAFGGVITQKSDVELILRRAQMAILNPTVETEHFVNMSVEEMKSASKKLAMLKFSKNVVCVDLSGPELTDLAFVDLPGIIQNAEAQTVKLVEDLVRSHIKGNCLILVTVPMSDDIENQKAFQIAKQEDPAGRRTIGVMTKPDTLTTGATKARGIWLDVIEGRLFSLQHGYYCTRQPDDDERTRGITSEQARTAEMDFFKKTAPWSTSKMQHQFGTRNLIANLSRLLSNIIGETLPILQNQVDDQLELCNSRLSSLPPAITTDPSSFVLSMITAFCSNVSLLVTGDSQNSELVQYNRQTYDAYKVAIRSTAPRFVPYANKNDATNAMKTAGADEFTETGSEAKQGGQIFLDDIRRHIESSLTRELPNNVPYSAKVALIRKMQTTWEHHSNTCLNAVQTRLEAVVTQLIHARFERYEVLKAKLTRLVLELLRAKHAETWKQVQFLLQCEGTPYTQNEHYLQEKKDKYMARYKDARAGKVAYREESAVKKIKVAVQEQKFGQASQPSSQSQSQLAANPNFFLNNANIFGARPVSQQAAATGPSSGPTSTATSPPPFAFTGRSSSTSAVSTAAPGFAGFGAAANTPGFGTPTGTPGFGAFGTPPTPPATSTPQAVPQPTSQKRPHAQMEPAERSQLENEVLALLARIGYTGATAEDLGKLVPPDVYEKEMDVMAEVRAYFHVAYKRLIDYIPLAIDHAFLFSFSASLQSHLITELVISSEDRCKLYLAEDPQVVHEREELLGRKKRLETVKKELDIFFRP
ncbi:hypothetical protein EUX98_g1377 [Antrodiella citrinella]|uniref:GED domain-containing protein n=1 Tax=Antrodiella citrinella TaxID=2447956 RepID=A0A4S4N9Y7_9APHY|nr:hypothetical protein EUX98_g1377 [Antrodiella citrinella]